MSAEFDPIEAIEQALVAMRRSQSERRLQRMQDRGRDTGGHLDGPRSGPRTGPHAGTVHDGESEPDPAHEQEHHRHGPRIHGPHGRAGGHGRGGALGAAARFRMLDALEAADGALGITELAEAISVDQPRASRLAQAATASGQVRRELDPADARRSRLVITDAGREVLAQARRSRRAAVENAVAGFTPDELTRFAQLLQRFVAAWPQGR